MWWFPIYCTKYSFPQQVISMLILVFYYYLHTIYQYPQTNKNKYITADDATPNPLLAGEEALLDAGEEAAATAMEA